jgi:4'-phosphopantetheinyl transferase
MAFIKVWTLKESFVKATGLGLSIPLSSFSFEVLDSDRPKIKVLSRSLREYADWGVISFSPAEGYLGAISTNQINFVAKDVQLGIQDFLSLV